MRTASPELQALLASSNQFVMADLYTLTLLGGAVLRYTTTDIDITYGGNTWSANGPRIERGRMRLVLGVEVDTLDVTIYPSASDLIAGQPFARAAVFGALDGARLRLDRAFLPAWGQPVAGTVLLFEGRLSTIPGTRTAIRCKVTSDLELLNVPMPPNVYQPPCGHSVYDSGCGLLRAAFTVSGTVTAADTEQAFGTDLAAAADYYALGVLGFTSGANAGLRRTVKAHAAGGDIALLLPLPSAPQAGDTFTVYPGCDKTMSTCDGKFSNLGRFRGMPFIPEPETAL